MLKSKLGLFTIALFCFSTGWAGLFSESPKEKQDRECGTKYYRTVQKKITEFHSVVLSLESISGSTYCSPYVEKYRNEKKCRTEAKRSSYQNLVAVAVGVGANSTSENSKQLAQDMQDWSTSRQERVELLKAQVKAIESEILSLNAVRHCMNFNGAYYYNESHNRAMHVKVEDEIYNIGRGCPVNELYSHYLNQTRSSNVLDKVQFTRNLGRFAQKKSEMNYCDDSTGKLASFEEYVKNAFSKIDN